MPEVVEAGDRVKATALMEINPIILIGGQSHIRCQHGRMAVWIIDEALLQCPARRDQLRGIPVRVL
jgi:hypothetical protein